MRGMKRANIWEILTKKVHTEQEFNIAMRLEYLKYDREIMKTRSADNIKYDQRQQEYDQINKQVSDLTNINISLEKMVNDLLEKSARLTKDVVKYKEIIDTNNAMHESIIRGYKSILKVHTGIANKLTIVNKCITDQEQSIVTQHEIIDKQKVKSKLTGKPKLMCKDIKDIRGAHQSGISTRAISLSPCYIT